MKNWRVLVEGNGVALECLQLLGSYLYYAVPSQNTQSNNVGEVQRLHVDTLERETVAKFPTSVCDFAFDGAGVLHAMDRYGKILYRAKDANTIEVVAKKVANSIHFAAHGEHFVWGGTFSGSNTVYITKASKIAPRSIASGLSSLTSLIADEHGVVFTANQSGKRSGGVYAAGWNDEKATVLDDGMAYCRRGARVGDTVWYSAEYTRPSRFGLFRVRPGEAPALGVAAFDPRGFAVEEDRVVCGEYSGEVMEYFFDGTKKELAKPGGSIADTAVTKNAVFVAMYAGPLLYVPRS